MPAVRVRKLLVEPGYDGGQTILNDYLRELRPLYLPRPRTFQRTSYRPGALCQFDLWEPSSEVPVGHGQTRRGYVVVGCLPYSRVGAGTLVFSKEAPDLLYGIGGCLQKLGALPETLVWDREGALHAGGGRPTDPFAAFCGQLGLDWRFLEPRDPESKGAVERLQGFIETSFEPGRRFLNELHFQDELDRWFAQRANVRFHRTLALPAGRPPRRGAQGDAAATGAAARPRPPLRHPVAPDPYFRVDTNDYSLDPTLVGRRLDARVSQREVTAVVLDSGELACRHRSLLRPSPHDHRARAREGAQDPARRAGRTRGRAAAAYPLRRPDPGVTKTSELTHLFRVLKAPAAAKALPKLAERARAEEWSYEQLRRGATRN